MNDILATVTDIDMQKTFAEYLNIYADLYIDTVITKNIIPARVITALNRDHRVTMYDLLTCTINDFMRMRNMGGVALTLTIEALKKYCTRERISYSKSRVFPKISDILRNSDYDDFVDYCKSIGKLSPYDLLNNDYNGFRIQYNHTYKYVNNIRKLLAEFCAINSSVCNYMCSVDRLMSLYCHSDYCLAQIFGVFPEMYNDVKVEDVGYNTLCTHSLTRNFQQIGYCRTLSDVLYCTIDDLHKFYALGKLSVLRIITKTREYIKRNPGMLIKRKHRSYCDTSIKLQELNYTFMEVDAKRSHKGQLYSNMDSKLIDRLMRASLLLDTELYSAALEQSSEMLDILNALNNFADPIL